MILTNHYLVNMFTGQKVLLSSYTVGNIVDVERYEWILIEETHKIIWLDDHRWTDELVEKPIGRYV